ncbi:MAG: DISARM system phospholipase D-like protein DrmC [Planctomyces sp.]|jgi:phosphatidylserine/phosphatidylglycerophosphate/cardiolipin synthase-like enzyme
MASALTQLNDRSLHRLLEAMASGRLSLPVSSLTLAQMVPQDQLSTLKAEFDRLQSIGLTEPVLIEWIRTVLHERERNRSANGLLELVMTGPEPPGTMIRDTGVVVRQMFLNATESIWICGFAVYQGKEIFQSLAQQMTSVPDLSVRMFLNIERPYGDTTPTDMVIAKFRQRFKQDQWPADVRLPDVYFDPRALEPDEAGKSACLHAKFVIADSRRVFISSANFTEAAQQRNIEAGLFAENQMIARDLRTHFQSLIDHEYLKQLKWY